MLEIQRFKHCPEDKNKRNSERIEKSVFFCVLNLVVNKQLFNKSAGQVLQLSLHERDEFE